MRAPVLLPASLRPSPRELAVGVMFGADPEALPLPPPGHPTIRAALEAVLAEALASTPCVIAFSGGRDSSVILAIALHVARTRGLPEPIAMTDRYPHVPESLEDDWQDRVAAHLRPKRWLRVDRGTEHEVLGAAAQGAMRRHGVLLPGNWAATSMPPEAGHGGMLVSGYGGDELFSPPPLPVRSALRARRRPPLRRLHTLPVELLPRGAKRRVAYREASSWAMPWVLPAVQRQTALLEAADAAAAPPRYDTLVRLLSIDRDVRSGTATAALMAAESGAGALDPFLAPQVLAAAARRYGPRFPRSRSAALQEIAGDLLPADVLQRASKADFSRVFYGEASRSWVEAWDGSGADAVCVDAAALRRELLAAEPDSRAVPSLQVAWLALDQASARD